MHRHPRQSAVSEVYCIPLLRWDVGQAPAQLHSWFQSLRNCQFNCRAVRSGTSVRIYFQALNSFPETELETWTPGLLNRRLRGFWRWCSSLSLVSLQCKHGVSIRSVFAIGDETVARWYSPQQRVCQGPAVMVRKFHSVVMPPAGSASTAPALHEERPTQQPDVIRGYANCISTCILYLYLHNTCVNLLKPSGKFTYHQV
jgi:hypothetical protein